MNNSKKQIQKSRKNVFRIKILFYVSTTCHPSFNHYTAFDLRLYVHNLNLLLVDPVMLRGSPVHNLLRLEPESDLLLRIFDAIRAMANISADINTEVAADGAGQGGEWVGGAKEGCR
jgi:hypothetical protein